MLYNITKIKLESLLDKQQLSVRVSLELKSYGVVHAMLLEILFANSLMEDTTAKQLCDIIGTGALAGQGFCHIRALASPALARNHSFSHCDF